MSDLNGIKLFGKRLPPAEPVSSDPDWKQASTSWIERTLKRVLEQPHGGWYVLGEPSEVTTRPRKYRVHGIDLVAWRPDGEIVVAPDACPHMGASLSSGYVKDGCVVCPWHGLRLKRDPHQAWKPLATYDDGVLLWVQLDGEAEKTAAPILPERPEKFFGAVMRRDAECDPRDVIANRLDPWHGPHYHPHSFNWLRVIDQQEDSITVRVTYRVLKKLGMQVDARFHCPDPRTICMTIVGGEGVGSLVETHATPLEPGRTAVIEATLATSDRPEFHGFTKVFGGLLRPLVKKKADKLWVEDAAYAERRYAIRTGQV